MKKYVYLLVVIMFVFILHTMPIVIADQQNRGQGVRGQGVNSTENKQEKRIALVIGNSAYEVGALANPVNDARDLAAALRKLGFEVIEATNKGKKEMELLVREFGGKIKNGGVGLFYFAGHGIQIRDRNYLIPIGANIEKEGDVEYDGVDVGRVLVEMDAAQNRLNIVILDACRNNPYSRSFRSTASGLAQIKAPSGTIISYATAPGEVASDGIGKNGLYTQELLKYIQEPGLEIGIVFRKVRQSVNDKSGKKQLPWESSSITGEFYFAGGTITASSSTETVNPSNSTTKLDKSAEEENYWKEVDKTKIEELKAYLEEYPTGKYEKLARAKIKGFEEARNSGGNSNASNNNSNGSNSNKPNNNNAGSVGNSNNSSTVAGTAMGADPAVDKRMTGEYVYIPAGNFTMGSSNGESDEKPEQEVVMSRGFEMGKHEVTQEQWEAVMGNNPSYFKGDGRLPVEQVSWEDVQKFISALNSRSRKYTYRLPTEAEWEYAARAGSRGDYAGNLDAMGWYSSNSGNKTHPVGEKQPNVWGLYDMHGNVYEWCSDWYGNYSRGTLTDPSGASSGSVRVIRGGCYYNDANNCRSANRGSDTPDNRYKLLGFRLLRTPK